MVGHSATLFNHKEFLANLPNKPGVYCLLNQSGTILYVGKARALKKRLSSYFTSSKKNVKTQVLVSQIAHIEVTITHTEPEALILENTLIKTHQPHYNILLRDDKSYPYIYLSEHSFPRLSWHRGVKRAKGRYFGPYPHSRAVHETLSLLQKIFLLRSCRDSFFQNRSRPCLQYQIKRCTAPCVGFIDQAAYQEEVQHVILFLTGKSQEIITMLLQKMAAAAHALEFEQAAKYRDQIYHLRQIQEPQCIVTEHGNVDIVVGVIQDNWSCIQILRVRDGQSVANQAFFPHIPSEEVAMTTVATLLAAFLPQYYLTTGRQIPDEIILNSDIADLKLLAQVIGEQRGRSVYIHFAVRGKRRRWLEMALANAHTALQQRQPQHYRERLAALSIALHLEMVPQRLECVDVSHTHGEATVAACVVFDEAGPCYRAYRRFNIDNVTPGDDYAAMQQVLRRRFSRLQQENVPLPDIVFVDGGIGQVKVAQQVLTELELNNIYIIGIAKGPERKPGLERLILSEGKMSLTLPKDSPALHLIQHIRDEAHRVAITAHRQRRAQVRRISALEQIVGIGPKRRQRLLSYFGSLAGVAQASVAELMAVPGIDQQLAQHIYHFLNTT